MTFTQPRTRDDWNRFKEDVTRSKAADFPTVDAAKFEQFKAGAMELTDAGTVMRSTLIGIAPIAVLILVEWVLRLFRPGAILWLAATIWIIFNNVRMGLRRRKLMDSTFALGREIGIVT